MKKVLFILVFIICLIMTSCSIAGPSDSQSNNNDINSEIECDEDSSAAETNTKNRSSNPIIPNGFEYLEGTVDTGYVIIHKASANEFVWIPVDGKKVKLAREMFYEDGSGEFPPDWHEVGEYDEELKESVNKYGGFYIARYEAGVGDIERTNADYYTYKDSYQKAYSIPGSYVYNWVEYNEALKASNAMAIENDFDSSVISTLISPAAWDTTLNWIALTDKDFLFNSYGKGYYTNDTKSMPQKTGQYRINNIYDMAGNVSEWTTETEGTLPILRGGDCRFDGYSKSGSGAVYTRSAKGYFTQGVIAQRGFRVLLIIR